jgi:hypothetical protein
MEHENPRVQKYNPMTCAADVAAAEFLGILAEPFQ